MALIVDGLILVLLGDYARAQARGEQALEEHRAREYAWGIGTSLLVLGEVALQRGDLAQADALHAEAARQMRAAGNPAEIGGLLQLTQVACELGQLDRARELIAEIEAWAAHGRNRSRGCRLHLRALVAAADGAMTTAAAAP